MTYYQFAIRQNKIYVTLFIMNYEGGSKLRKELSWVAVVLLSGPSTHLNKYINNITAMIK